MSEQPYTPSTVEVRNAYRLSDQDIDGSPYLPEKSDTEFDRWLAQERDKALDPIRRILDQLAGVTEPPCDRETWIEAYRMAVHDISVHVYPEEDR